MPEGASVRTRPEKQTTTLASTHTHTYAHIYIHNISRYLYITIYHYVYICVIIDKTINLSICIYLFVVVASSVQVFMGHGPRLQPLNPRSKTVLFVGSPLRPSCAWNSSTKHSPSASGSPKSLASVERQTGSWDGMGWALHHTSTVNFDVVSPLP